MEVFLTKREEYVLRDYENASRKENWYIKKLIHERSLNMMLDSQREVFPPSDGILIFIP